MEPTFHLALLGCELRKSFPGVHVLPLQVVQVETSRLSLKMQRFSKWEPGAKVKECLMPRLLEVMECAVCISTASIAACT